MSDRTRLAVILGGRSPEHEVSVVSARSIIREADPERFEVVPFGITRGGAWLTPDETAARLEAVEAGRTAGLGEEEGKGLLAAAGVLAALRKRTLSSTVVDDRRRKVQAYARARRRQLDDAAAQRWNDTPISTVRLTKELNAKMADDAIVVSELITSEEYLPAYMDVGTGAASRTNYTSSGGVLGWGVAAGIGAKIGRPDRQVVALLGDGSLQFGIQALWSAVRYDVPLAVVVYNNGGYQANRKFLHLYGRRAAATGKYVGANLQGPDIDNVSLCKGYGVEAERVDDPAKLDGALDRCFEATANGRPYLVDVRLARRLGGADSTWYDHFSIAKGERRRS